MEALFSQLTRMSFAAGWMILAVIAARPFLKKAPRSLVCLLWGLASLRLLVPVTVKSRVSLVPTQAALPEGIRWVAPAAATTAPVQAAQAVQKAALSPTAILAWIWFAGMVLMASYAAYSYIRLYRRVAVSMRMEKNIYLCDHIPSPFILGVFRPKIYIPSALTRAQIQFVLAHEQAHLHRGDHLWKPLGYLLLSIYWFNPLCWAAYILFCRDMELACDERVVKTMEKQERSAYSHTLLECSVRSQMISACPLAFGEVGVKARVRSVLNYRKPAAWVVAISCVLCAVLTCCFLTDPVQAEFTIAEGQFCVLVEDATLMSEPEGKTITTLAAGTIASIQEEQAHADGTFWVKITYPDADKPGWVERGCLTAVQECSLIYTSHIPVTIYTAPSPNAAAVGELNVSEGFELVQQCIQSTGTSIWVYGTSADQQITGWLLMPMTDDITPEDPAAAGQEAIAVTNVNVRSAPSVQSRAVDLLHLGDSVTINRWETVDDILWCYVRYDGDHYGWVVGQYLSFGEIETAVSHPTHHEDAHSPHHEAAQNIFYAAPEGSPATSAANCALYSSPSHQARIITTLELAQPVTITGRETIGDTAWCYVTCNDGTVMGWVEAENLAIPEEVNANVVFSVPDYTGQGVCQLVNPAALLSSPSAQARVISELAAGTAVTVLRQESIANKDWCYVNYDEGQVIGWIEAENLAIPEETNAEAAVSFPGNTNQEFCQVAQSAIVHSAPSTQAREISTLDAGTIVSVLRRESIANTAWCYVGYDEGMVVGWVEADNLKPCETNGAEEALAFLDGYAAAILSPTPDAAEAYYRFASEEERTLFRQNYQPQTDWDVTAFQSINPNLWAFLVKYDGGTRYCFVGRQNGEYAIYLNELDIPEALRDGLIFLD